MDMTYDTMDKDGNVNTLPLFDDVNIRTQRYTFSHPAVLHFATQLAQIALVVTKQTAEELGLTSIADLNGKAGDLVLGGPPEFETRPNGVAGLKEVYGLEFKQFRSLAAGSNLTVQALANGQVDAANIFTTDPAIEENDFVVLEDPESLFAAQNVVPLIRKDAVNPTVEEALDAVSAALTTENLTQMMVQVVSEGQDPADVAREFVDANL